MPSPRPEDTVLLGLVGGISGGVEQNLRAPVEDPGAQLVEVLEGDSQLAEKRESNGTLWGTYGLQRSPTAESFPACPRPAEPPVNPVASNSEQSRNGGPTENRDRSGEGVALDRNGRIHGSRGAIGQCREPHGGCTHDVALPVEGRAAHDVDDR